MRSQTALTIRSIETASGRISFAEAGSGPVALFVHGVGAKPPVELAGARIFFPEERAEVFNQLLRDQTAGGIGPLGPMHGTGQRPAM